MNSVATIGQTVGELARKVEGLADSNKSVELLSQRVGTLTGQVETQNDALNTSRSRSRSPRFMLGSRSPR
eukprot:5679389-Prymnesium_polylepis.1